MLNGLQYGLCDKVCSEPFYYFFYAPANVVVIANKF